MKIWDNVAVSDDRFENHTRWMKEINRYGIQGWELVTVTQSGNVTTAYLKRPRS